MLFFMKKLLAASGYRYAEAGIIGVVGGGGKNEEARVLALVVLSKAMVSWHVTLSNTFRSGMHALE